MDKKETKRFDKLYQRHLQMLKLQGKSAKTRGRGPVLQSSIINGSS